MRTLAMLLIATVTAANLAQAAPPASDPDWPCRQRLVPELTAATFWNGPPLPENAKWQDDKRLAEAVPALAARDLPVEDGVAQLNRFADKLKPAERKTVLPALFVGLVESVNRERGETIQRIEELARRQRSIGDVVAKVSAELRTIPADAQGDDAQRRAEIVQRRDFVIRSFEETEHTMRYACEVPVDLEARLGTYARTLEGRL